MFTVGFTETLSMPAKWPLRMKATSILTKRASISQSAVHSAENGTVWIVAYTENLYRGVSFSGIWWSFVIGVRCLWRHNLTSYSCFQAKFVDIKGIFFDTHSPYFFKNQAPYTRLIISSSSGGFNPKTSPLRTPLGVNVTILNAASRQGGRHPWRHYIWAVVDVCCKRLNAELNTQRLWPSQKVKVRFQPLVLCTCSALHDFLSIFFCLCDLSELVDEAFCVLIFC